MRFLLLLLLLVTLAFPAAAQPAKANSADAKKIANATPAALPQSPGDGRPRTDAQDAGLKGRVQTVIDRQTDTSEPDYPAKTFTREEFYGGDGNRLRVIDWEGVRPTSVTVFGYLDGMRVSRRGDIDNSECKTPSGQPCVVMVQTVPGLKDKQVDKRDERYDIRWDYKYDAQGRLAEERHFDNAGELLIRTVYKYETAKKRTILHYAGGIEPLARTVEMLDNSGNVIEEWLHDEDDKISAIRHYSYKFDRQGNWTLQTVTEKDHGSKSKPKQVSNTRRTISYFD
jgi:hypothetical protein